MAETEARPASGMRGRTATRRGGRGAAASANAEADDADDGAEDDTSGANAVR